MKRTVPAIVLLATLTAAAFLRADLVDILVGKRELNVITVTDMTPAGRQLPAVTAQAPVYYVAATSGFKDLGGAEAGEKRPPNDEAIRAIAKVLAGQGYLPASASSPRPSLLLIFTWGTLNVNEIDLPDETGEGLMPVGQLNRAQMLRFLGARNVGDFAGGSLGAAAFAGLDLTHEEMDKFDSVASKDLYIAAVSAYDLKSASRQQKQLLWVTRIACPASGFSLQGVLPAMLAIAGPNIGRETGRPVWVNASDKYKPQVKLHDLQLLEYLDNGRLPVLEQSKNKAWPEPAKR